MSTRPHDYPDDTSYTCDQGVVPVSVPHPSREVWRPVSVREKSQCDDTRQTAGSSAIAPPRPLSPARDTTYPVVPTSHVRNENAPSSSLSDSKVPHDTQERVDLERDGAEHRKISATLSKEQGSIYAKGGEARDESQFRPLKEVDQYPHDRDYTDDKRDTPYGAHYASPKETFNTHRPPLAHAKDAETITPTSQNFQYLYEVQSRELRILEREYQAALDEKKRLANACASLTQQYEERSKKYRVARHERQEAQMQLKEIDNAYGALIRKYEEQRKELDAVRHEHQAAPERERKAEEHYTALRQKYETQSNGYNTLLNKYHSLKATLDQRTSELQGVQKFLTTADTFSGSEVVNTVRKLNEEVQQATTFMAEWAVEKFMLETPRGDQMATRTIEQTRTLEALGMRFMELLGTKKHRDSPILVEMALRGYLIYELYYIASPWSIGQEEQSHNVYINGIYQRMRDAEEQAISGNWRALTRAYMQLPGCISDAELAHKLDITIMSGFADILLAAGCSGSKSEIRSGLWSKFAEKVHHFVSLAGEVNKMIGVGVISEDFEVLVVLPETTFDAKAMEDSYDDGDRVQGTEEHQETVLCATELGLAQRMRVGAGAGQDGEPSKLIVVKPKVALVSVIDLIDK